MTPLRTDILIIGAGFAGAATAFHLSQRTSASIIIAEKEEVPGFHASGRNASLLMQSAENRHVRQLIVDSRKAYKANGRFMLSEAGSFLLGAKDQLEAVRDAALVAAQWCSPAAVRKVIPLLEGHEFEQALFTASDAIVDISSLLQFYLAGAQDRGAQLSLDCRVEKIVVGDEFQVTTSKGEIVARYLVNAAGAWASQLGEMAKAAALPLSPFKRHLFILGDIPSVQRDWPFAWSLARNFYFRPESGNLLFSICDEQRSKSLEPTVEPDTVEDLAELIWRELPSLRDAVQKRVWSCFRTKTPDGNFVVGWDQRNPKLFWVAGLGGHGMGSSWEVGRLAADLFLGRNRSAEHFAPGRFLGWPENENLPLGSPLES